MPRHQPTHVLTTRIPKSLMLQLLDVAADHKLPPGAFVRAMVVDFLNTQTARSPGN